MRFLRCAIVVAACAALFACGADAPIQWNPEVRIPGAMLPGARMVLTADGVPAVQAALEPMRWPEDSLACAATRVAIAAGGEAQLAAWWRASPSANGVAVAPDTLMLARTADGLMWTAPFAVAVAAARACRSAPPAIAADAASGAAHVAFHGRVAGQAGVGVARLDPGAGALSGVVLVSAGQQPRLVAVAARGDTVAVAYEASGQEGTTVWLAISVRKSQIPTDCGIVPDRAARAFAPVVALTDGRVAVGWNEARRGDRMPAAVARVGELRRACEPSSRD